MEFLYQNLAYGFLLAGIPVLIHLINMMRHRRVKWAAMDFLLKSYKKHRKWVWLKQFLLLLARILAIAIIVAMLAQWITRGSDWSFFGGQPTHHYVLMDDSESMGEQYGATTAYQTASRFVQRLATELADQQGSSKLTLLRFSRASLAGDREAGEVTDLNSEQVTTDFPELVESKRNAMEVTELATGPGPGLELLQQLMKESPNEEKRVYVVSDFRANTWESPADVRTSLRELEKDGAKIQLVNTTGVQRANLGIIDIRPSDDTRAAEVPLFVNVRVKNFSQQPVDNVQLKVRTAFFDNDQLGDTDRPAPQRDELPIQLIEQIGGGETVVKRVQVYFPKAGSHVVEAELPEDGLAADNRRRCVVEFPEGEPVLIVDGRQDQGNAFYLQSVFQPGQQTETGIQPDTRAADFLRDTSADQLARYRVIFLCDVPRLDQRAVTNLENYCRQGGGVAFFMGENVNMLSYNSALYNDGAGLFPLPLERDELLEQVDFDDAPDINAEDSPHPVFEEFMAENNPLIRMVRIERYLRPPADWLPDPQSTVRVVATLRNGRPLVVERQFGEGRVMVFLSTFGPYWNDLALGPNVILALKMQSYLAAPLRDHEDQRVGAPLDVAVDREQSQPTVRFFVPDPLTGETRTIERDAGTGAAGGPVQLPSEETLRGGVYEAWVQNNDGSLSAHRFAVNVEPAEGDLKIVESQEMLNQLLPVKPEVWHAEEFEAATVSGGGFNRSLMLMCLLIALLIGEQWLAYSASYHPVQGVRT